MGSLRKFKPLAAMIALQFGYAVMNIIAKASLTGGMNTHVFIVYRQAVATLVLSPIAYIMERKERPALRFDAFCQIFLMSFIGITINQNLYFKGLYLASPTIAAASSNSIPAVTFVIATVIGLEKTNFRGQRGQAKVLGAFICVGGAMTMALWKGPIIGELWPPNLHMARSHYLFADEFVAENWKIGFVYLFGSCLCWSTWTILQTSTVKKYPAQLSLTALMCFLGTTQSAVVTLIFLEPVTDVWALGWNFDLLCIVYSGVVGSGIAFCVQTWCIYERGPVFVAMFNPLSTVIVAIMALIILHEKLHAGSVAGGFFTVGGLYAVIWGKAKDIEPAKSLPGSARTIESADLMTDITQPLLASKVSVIVPHSEIPTDHP